MSQKPSVCHVVNAAVSGTVAIDISEALLEYTDINDVGVLAWFRDDNLGIDGEIDIYCLDEHGRLVPTLKNLRRADNFIKRYDIIQTYNPHSAFYAKLLGLKNGQPIVSREGNNHSSFTRKGRISNGLTNFFVDRVVCVSDSVSNSFSRWEDFLLDNKQVTVIYNGVDVVEIQSAKSIEWDLYDICGIPRDHFVISHAGRLEQQKAQDVLIRAVEQSDQQASKRIELVIAGDGEQREYLQSIAHKFGFADQVHFLGFIDQQEVYKMMLQSDLYVMPSRWEGFSMAVLQAMAAGVPCVLSEIPSFEPFRNVAEFTKIDDVEYLTSAINRVVIDERYRNELARQSQELVRDEYSIQKTAQEYAEIYTDIVS